MGHQEELRLEPAPSRFKSLSCLGDYCKSLLPVPLQCTPSRLQLVPFLKQHLSVLKIIFQVMYLAYRASLVAQLIKNLPAMQETLVQFLGREDPLAQMVKNPPAMWETWVPSLVGKIPWRR